jgi:hypothetical protein
MLSHDQIVADLMTLVHPAGQEEGACTVGKIYVPTLGAESWRRLLADPEKHWRTGFSAKTLAHCWEQANGLPAEIAAMLAGFGTPELLLGLNIKCLFPAQRGETVRTISSSLLALPRAPLQLPSRAR